MIFSLYLYFYQIIFFLHSAMVLAIVDIQIFIIVNNRINIKNKNKYIKLNSDVEIKTHVANATFNFNKLSGYL